MTKRFLAAFFLSVTGTIAAVAEPLVHLDGDSSYALGIVIGSQMEQLGIGYDEQSFSGGFYRHMTGANTLSIDEAIARVSSAFSLGSVENASTLDGDTSYALGVAIANQLTDDGVTIGFNVEQFANGLASIRSGSSVIAVDEAVEKVEGIIAAASETAAKENLEKSEEFMTANAKKSGVSTTDSGLQYAVVLTGGGKRPTEDSIVTVNYEGRLIDGTVFDSSYERGEPAEFPLADVIQGWTEGIQLMNVGSKFTFFIPPNLGYGDMAGIPIPPNSVLIFDVELLKIETEENAD
ncbi:MAG: FKBP-type peptidyl-prolyl cis-trans isomerase [Spirochaetaceae bacterium]|jgi:FKBP-type peptidyl-prolyl cis-trans isomerase|nr:FKBP-type peptidyl-prolyl cis-trans isomerase [Spirochaetaceae bacterium]